MKTVKFSEVKVKQHFVADEKKHEYVKINNQSAFCFNNLELCGFNVDYEVQIEKTKRNLLDRKKPVYAYVGDTEEDLKDDIIKKYKRIITHDLGEFGCLAVHEGEEKLWKSGELVQMTHWKLSKYCDEVDEKEPEYMDYEDYLILMSNWRKEGIVWQMKLESEIMNFGCVQVGSKHKINEAKYRILDKATKKWGEWKEFLKGGEK